MKSGILWFDDDPKAELSLKVSRAVDYIQHKYGRTPTLCYVHPDLLQKKTHLENGIEVRIDRKILPNHFWLELKL